MSFHEKRVLGRTGLMVGRMGISTSFGADFKAYEEAFERGCNYFTWGTFIRGRSKEFIKLVRKINTNGKRDQMALGMLTYAHQEMLTDYFYKRGLKQLGIDYADILLLGYYSSRPPQKVIDGALKLKEKGLVRYIGLTSHNRKLFQSLFEEGIFDVYHVRYNAAHRGAERDVFPFLKKDEKPGIVSFTATRWKDLLNSKKMPDGQDPLTARECYRFALSNPSVDMCMMGFKNIDELRENLRVLDENPLSDDEMQRIVQIGDYVHKNTLFFK